MLICKMNESKVMFVVCRESGEGEQIPFTNDPAYW